MNLTLHRIPNVIYFLEVADQCKGLVFLELKDQSYLNMKNNGEGKKYLENAGDRINGLRVITEKEEDAARLLNALMTS